MEKITIKINKADVPRRNELHFDVQRNTRRVVFENKKKYNRKKFNKNLKNID